MVVIEHGGGEGKLAEVALAIRGFGFFLCFGQGRDQKASENSDDRNDYEKLDESKAFRSLKMFDRSHHPRLADDATDCK